MSSKKRTENRTVFFSCLVLSLTWALPALADDEDQAADSFLESAPVSEEALEGAEEDVFELDTLEVTAEGLSFKQEFTLRMLKSALGKSKSQKQEDRNEWVCWLDKSTGSNFRYLHCARNGDLWALQPTNGLLAPPPGIGGYGTILRSSRPVNGGKLKLIMAQLNGPEDFDDEFVSLAMQGKQPPRDIPSDDELASFAEAYKVVTRMHARGRSEQSQIRAIESRGLTLERYNYIAGLTETYQSIENDIAARLE